MLDFLNDLLWGKVLIALLIAVGLGFTVASRFVQFRYFGACSAFVRQAFHHERPPELLPGVDAVGGRPGRRRQHRRRRRGDHPGRPGGGILDVGGRPDGHGHQLPRVHPGPGLQDRRARRHLPRRAGLLHRARPRAAAGLAGGLYSVLLLVTFGFAFTALQSYAVATSFDDAFGIPALDHRPRPGAGGRPDHLRRHQAHRPGHRGAGPGDGGGLHADRPGGPGPERQPRSRT